MHEVTARYRGSSSARSLQCGPATSPVNVAKSTRSRTHRAHAESSGLCSRCRSLSSRHLFSAAMSLIPMPPCSFSWHTFSHATRHCAPCTCSSPDQRNTRRRRSRASIVPCGSCNTDIA
ncbi:hypothetical protein PVAP13_7KG140455 [Panicum virgatum]|uniref:Uncharacterized protein n=1 Tax=Panicum virgatum TaxID=38727 RepID=A0A8T0QI57_PANVG|nr:hypothetical protein PVAP13_7KG140455 [Panicum virgatum]